MRILVMMLALSLIIPVGAAAQAQAQTQTPAPAQADRHTFLPQHKAKLSIDFGAEKAAKNIARLPVRCDIVRKHHRPAGIVELPIYGAHHRITTPASPCPVR